MYELLDEIAVRAKALPAPKAEMVELGISMARCRQRICRYAFFLIVRELPEVSPLLQPFLR